MARNLLLMKDFNTSGLELTLLELGLTSDESELYKQNGYRSA